VHEAFEAEHVARHVTPSSQTLVSLFWKDMDMERLFAYYSKLSTDFGITSVLQTV